MAQEQSEKYTQFKMPFLSVTLEIDYIKALSQYASNTQ
jgi:hypothetical protein